MAHTFSWLSFGGWPFVVSTTAMGGWHILFPRWTGAVGAVLVTASIWSPAEQHLKLTALTFLSMFCVLGQPFNNAWGLITGPTYGLAAAYGVLGVQQLIRAAAAERGSSNKWPVVHPL
jgi:hypothetical protein